VFNTTDSLREGVKFLPEKVLLLNSFIKQHGIKLSLFKDDNRIPLTKFKMWGELLTDLGLDSVPRIFNSSAELANFLKTNKQCIIITGVAILKDSNRVVFTNSKVGLMKPDLDKVKSLL
jgi:hypothetical protein